MSRDDRKLRNERVLGKLIDYRHNLKELNNVTRLGTAYIANQVLAGRVCQWVKVLQ